MHKKLFLTFNFMFFQVIAEDSNEEVTFQGVVLNFNSLKDNLSEVNSRSQIEGDWKQVEMSLSPSTYRVFFQIVFYKRHKLV